MVIFIAKTVAKMIDYRIVLKSPSKKGLSRIYFIVGKTWITTGLKVDPLYYNTNTRQIKKADHQTVVVSSLLETYKSRTELYLADINIHQMPFNSKKYKDFVFNKKSSVGLDLIKFCREFAILKNLSYGRTKQYNVVVGQLLKYKPGLDLASVDYSTLMGFQVYLRSEHKNEKNTINGKLKKIKALIGEAVRQGYIKEDLTVDVKIKEVKPMRFFLTVEELEQLEKLYQSDIPLHLRNTLQYFLFCCYTGLRYSDVRQLKSSDVTSEAIYIKQEKTDKPILVPLIPKAKLLIDYTKKGYVFDVLSNQKSNENLKAIASLIKFEKRLTFHISRHTFATLSIYFGIPMEVVAELLGVDMKTVKIYAKIMEQVKFTEMKKWG